MNIKILDLGCGKNKIKGSIGLDNVPLDDVDIVHDILNIPYPLEDNSFDKIYLRNVLEHFLLKDIRIILSECYRLLSSNGNLIITIPHAFSVAAYTDITHKSYFTFNSGKFFDKTHPQSYYKEIPKYNLKLVEIDCETCWFDWKGKILRKFDLILSKLANKQLSNALKNIKKPSLADRIVKKNSYQFVEIKWIFKKNDAEVC